jgi:hypothetical protein
MIKFIQRLQTKSKQMNDRKVSAIHLFPKFPTRSQGLVEFAIVMPILLLLIYGLVEVGRVIFTYGIVTTASREAVRYGSATGLNGDWGVPGYDDCAGIRGAAQNVDFLGVIEDENIIISYDHGPGTMDFSVCPSQHIASGDRIKIQISADFVPIVPIIPWAPWTIVSNSSRTILTSVDILGTVQAPPPLPTKTPTASQTATITPTTTDTPTITQTLLYSMTPSDTPTTTGTPTITYTPTNTPTEMFTRTSTDTPTPTATPFVCSVRHSGTISSGADVTWRIFNDTSIPLQINLVVIFWSSNGGRTLSSVSLDGEILWYGNTNASGFSVPGQPFTLPPGETGLRLVFAKSTSNIQVILTFSNPGCSVPLDSNNTNQEWHNDQ